MPEIAAAVLDRRADDDTEGLEATRALRRWCAVRGFEPPPSWPETVRRACVGTESESLAPAVSPGRVRIDSRSPEWNSPNENLRTSALERLGQAIEAGRLDPRDASAAESILRRALADPLPWNRIVAADALVLLGTSSDAVYQRALVEIFRDFDEDRTGPTYAWRVAARFRHASPEATLRFARALVRHAAPKTGERLHDLKVQELLGALGRDLVARDSTRLDDFLETLHPVLGLDVEYGSPIQYWVTHFEALLRTTSAVDSAAPSKLAEYLALTLESRSLVARRSATSLAGMLWSDLPRDALAPLRDRLVANLLEANRSPGPDHELVERTALASARLLAIRPEWVSDLHPRLVETLSVRRVHGPARTETARALLTTVRHLAPSPRRIDELWNLVDDPDPDVRRRVGQSLVQWLIRDPSLGSSLVPELEDRIRAENDVDVLVEWMALKGLAGRGEHAGWAIDRLAELRDRGGREAAFRVGEIAATHPDEVPRALDFFDRCWRRETSSALDCTIGARDLANTNPRLARRVVDEIFVPMLFEAPGRLGQEVILSGLGPLGKWHPEVASAVVTNLERIADDLVIGRITLRTGNRRLFMSALESTWLDVAVGVEKADSEFLFHYLRAVSGWRRGRGLALLERIVRDDPRRRAGLLSELYDLRRSWRPELRKTASRGIEIVRLHLLYDSLDLDGQEALRELAGSVRVVTVDWPDPVDANDARIHARASALRSTMIGERSSTATSDPLANLATRRPLRDLTE